MAQEQTVDNDLIRLDHECIADILDLGDDLLGRLVQSIRNDICAFRQQLDADSQDASQKALLLAHSLKGACFALGARGLGDAFGGWERMARAGAHAQIPLQFDQSTRLIDGSLEALAAIAAQGLVSPH